MTEQWEPVICAKIWTICTMDVCIISFASYNLTHKVANLRESSDVRLHLTKELFQKLKLNTLPKKLFIWQEGKRSGSASGTRTATTPGWLRCFQRWLDLRTAAATLTYVTAATETRPSSACLSLCSSCGGAAAANLLTVSQKVLLFLHTAMVKECVSEFWLIL